MTAEIYEVKDQEPNQELIGHLEKMLEQARAGVLRSHFTVCGWNDDCVSHCWVIDSRNSRIRMLGETVLAQHNLATDINLGDADSTLYRALYE